MPALTCSNEPMLDPRKYPDRKGGRLAARRGFRGAWQRLSPQGPAGAAQFLRLSLLCIGALLTGTATAVDLSPAEVRGKAIYTTGTSVADRKIIAFVGAGAIPVPGNATPCSGCHGPDGLGRPESGVVPANITWSQLTKPYGGASPGGRRRYPPYDEEILARTIRTGIDPGGNRLDPAMPRFQIAPEDLDDLVAYLKRLETDLDPGLDEERIVVATIVPGRGPLAPVGEAVTAVLSAYFDDVNAQAGVYGRRIELLVESADSAQESPELAEELAAGNRVFALVAAFTSGVDEDFATLAETHGVPLVAPFTQSAPEDTALNRFTNYLLSGPETQGRALVDFAAGRLPDAGLQAAIVYRSDATSTPVARAMVEQARKWDHHEITQVSYPPGAMDAERLAAELKGSGVQSVFFVGSGDEFRSLVKAAEQLSWSPFLFMHGQFVGRRALAAPRRFQGRIYLAYPTSPADHSEHGRRAFSEFHQRHALSNRHVGAQVTAYATAKLLIHALKQSGRALSRDKLLSSLEGLNRYATGLTPALTYGPNRHVGALGAHIVGVNLETGRFARESAWVEPQ